MSGPVALSGKTGILPALDISGHFLVNALTGKPLFLTGESPFTLISGISNADVETYLADRSTRGFNAVWVAGPDSLCAPNAPFNFYGDQPFDNGVFQNFDVNYWAHVDYVIKRAAQYGIIVMLAPGFVGFTGQQGYLANYAAASSATMTAYGTFLGNRYKASPNIIWALGGDADPTQGAYTNLGVLGAAIRAADPAHLITLEACRSCTPANQNSITALGGAPAWLSLNWIYNTQPTVVSGCQAGYAVTPFIPALMGEDWYELEHSMTTFQIRQEGYWETLSGCNIGRIFSNSSINCFNSTNANGCFQGLPSWQSQLSSGGSVAQQYLGTLMRSREHWKLVPDVSNVVLTGGISSGATLSVASCTSDGQTCIVFDSTGTSNNPQIAMGHFTGTVHAWWFNPASAATTDLATFTNSGTHTFVAPDGNDWVLVLDLNSAGLCAPGACTI